ncbi:e3 ubiquitin-protein ligase siah2 [Holotrichia oblita]|uniref:E3 ubiquitin-protein ligase siah2 n=1 Tax=Holotrichia oblita TaxID=644536 RepID=A0ACB9T197_HOLOL|nr:e3 ubiquitin-protein ligase siah2 [Holotrichia oblita]
MLDIPKISSVDELSEDDKQNLQCGYCGNLLSVPGITVPDAKDSLYACGRCSKTKGSGIPAYAYETLASLVKFPCRYVTYGCKKKFLMEAVLDHERACKHRIYKCFAVNCNWEGAIAALKGHITNCHSNIILKDGSFKMPVDDITSVYIMYMYDEIYLVKVHVKDLIFHLGVKYLGKPPECGRFTYEAEIKKTGAKQQSSIKLYNGKMKCYTDYKNLNEKIDVDFDIKSLDGIFKTRKVDCFINIIENVPRKEKLSKQTATNPQETKNNEVVGGPDALNMQTDNTIKTAIKEEITSTDNTNKNGAKNKKKNNNTGKSSPLKEQRMQYENQQADMIRELECPVCQEYIYPPIMICVSGHSICGDCKSKLTKCPTCSSEYGNTRNYALESMLNLVQLPCRNDVNGCEFLGNFAALQEHKANCKYAEFKCPVPYHCKWVGSDQLL